MTSSERGGKEEQDEYSMNEGNQVKGLEQERFSAIPFPVEMAERSGAGKYKDVRTKHCKGVNKLGKEM